ncbi:vWA domain-containing protein [Calycomorphotria hydatis]|uniref:VWFA domain-containing protein n=1 Tax=Calycomorphotria hydatis TaxID=2528027 RepID=A0A517T6Q6_9PLAN|nr:VWA domain-containing protein [Calycomorphotria hydatis]QDT64056.1 hypothetical protein V22_12860 [Calycomorphotria hydatis]
MASPKPQPVTLGINVRRRGSSLLRASYPHPGGLVPSWFFSLCFHAALLLVVATNLKSCGGSAAVDADGDYRSVGLVARPSDSIVPSESETTEDQVNETAIEETFIPTAKPVENNAPPIKPTLPKIERPKVIGPGPTRPKFSPSQNQTDQKQIKPRSGSPPATAGLAAGQSEFFGIRDTGQRFVYVIDCSGSMAEHNKLAMAKAELLASLQGLASNQQFQIIFYNQSPQSLKIPARSSNGMFHASDINRTLAGQIMGTIHPSGGTDHLPALEKALALNPDVVFLLTDADEPKLSARDLDSVRRWNRRKTRIHTVEFGIGPQIGIESYLQVLSRRNDGSHQYRDTTQFSKR